MSETVLINAPVQPAAGTGTVNALGFHDPKPVFSWKLPAGVEKQTAYEIEVSNVWKNSRVQAQPASNGWKSGWVESEQSVYVPYGGEPFSSRQQVEWRVRFRDQDGNESEWSDAARFEMGLLNGTDWNAAWIRPAEAPASEDEPVFLARREFNAEKEIKHARLYAAARGLFELYLNGSKVGEDAFVPGWTSYSHRLDTLTYDVTGLIQSGSNALGAMCAQGWYAGHLAWEGRSALFGPDAELMIQLEITYADGSMEQIVSDEQWKATRNGPIRSSGLYAGECYDAHFEMPGWSTAGFDDAAWGGVGANTALGIARLTPKPFAPVRCTEVLNARRITEPEAGRFVFDLGQNMVGWQELSVPVEASRRVTVRFAEMLNQDGTLYTDNYRSARSRDEYIPAETGTITWKPTFTFHGFRYVELSGLPDGVEPQLSWVKGHVLHSDLPRIGKFESSHEKLNQLQSNISWGLRGNFVDIPTDCPQRDERLGWTADAQVFCPTSMFNRDCLSFWKSWLRSVRDDQMPGGMIPNVIPALPNINEPWWQNGGSPGWVDAAIIIPWEVYVRSGDRSVLEENVELMRRHTECWRGQAVDGLIPEKQAFGDWLQPYADRQEGDTPSSLLATAFYANSAQIMANTCKALGLSADEYEKEAEFVRQAFASQWFGADGRLINAPETQTAYLLAIAFDLIPQELQPKAAEHLVALIHAAEDHLRTGFLGTPFIALVLDRMGYADLAYTILFKETYPSWFYSINQGATTMWERWNSYSHEDGFGDANMNSFNHYAYGAIGQWMVERIAGLAPDPDVPGYKHFFIRPLPGGPLSSARAELETLYGKAASAWEKSGSDIVLNVTVPPNTTATVGLPDGKQTVAAGEHEFRFSEI